MHATDLDHASPDQLLTTEDIARRLGVSVKTVRRWVTTGRLPFSHLRLPNGVIRVPRRGFELYLSAATKDPKGTDR